MVAIKYNSIKTLRLTLVFVAVALFGATATYAQESSDDTPSEELSSDSTYVALIALDAKYSAESDSLTQAVLEYRKLFLGGGEQAVDAQTKIISLEQSIFNLRTERNALQKQIEAIEQQRMSQNQTTNSDGSSNTNNNTPTTNRNNSGIYPTEIVGLISQSSIVASTLSKDDLNSLTEADNNEAKVSSLYNTFMDSYLRASELQQLYNQTEVESEAIAYETEFATLQDRMDSISTLLTPIWREIYDDKVFIYSLLLETLNNNELLQSGLKSIRTAEMNASDIGDNVASESVVSYMHKKLALVEFESSIAERFNLPRATDSLLDVAQKLMVQRSSSELPTLSIKPRSFIPYDPIVYSTNTIYNKENPIPTAIKYSRGNIYRIQFGAYRSQQDASLFKGASPLSVEVVDGMYTYYGGAYATYVEAEAAAADSKAKGFNRPEIVVWLDGERRNLFRDPLPATNGYNIVIDGSATLASETSSIIDLLGGGAKLTRIATNKYVVSPLRNILIAEDLASALRDVNREETITINEISK